MSRFVELVAPIFPLDMSTGEPMIVPVRTETGEIEPRAVPPIPMLSWLMQTVGGGKDGASPKMGKGIELADRVYRLRLAFTDAMKRHDIDGRQYCEIEDADWQAVTDCLVEYQPGSVLIWAQLRPFLHAWKPETKQDEDWKRRQNVKAVAAP